MSEYLNEHKAEAWIGYIFSYVEEPDLFLREDWEDWKPRIQRSLNVVKKENLKIKGREIISFFNKYFN